MDSETLIEVYAPQTLKWLYETISSLCDDEMAVFIECDVFDKGATYRVNVAKEDIGKVIGKRGHNAAAIRTLLHARGKRDGTNYAIDLREGPKPAPRPGGRPVFTEQQARAALCDGVLDSLGVNS